MACNLKTGLVYVNSWEIARVLKYTKFEFVLGQGSTGVETSFRTPPEGEPWGYHYASRPLGHEGGRASADAGQDHQVVPRGVIGLGEAGTRVDGDRPRSDRDVRDGDQSQARE